ncbi:hypothetical protein SK128_022380 [Halocaridina rubra]|uniref:Uncharacterized protein n=1 Tax=Halocaridina rubra TaxID=373956 RepID=A0AAN8X4Z1_HALRR
MLDQLEQTTDAGDPANTPEPSSHPNDDTQHAANQLSSPPYISSSFNSPPSSVSPSLTHTGVHNTSSDSGISSPSKINSYTCGKDSKVYRNVSPKIVVNGKRERVVNSALCNTKEPSSPTWKILSDFQSPITPSNSLSNDGNNNEDSPRILQFTREESISPNPQSTQTVERRYEGGNIPSRVFRQLQSDYPSGNSNELQEPKSRLSSKSPSPHYEGGVIPPRVLKSFQSEVNMSMDSDTTDGENASRASSSMAELDEYYHNGMAHTAVNKDTVLKELASQFDHTGIRKKPKAAPGRVFRYLQAQYDSPEEPLDKEGPSDNLKPEKGNSVLLGYKGAKVPSPSFRFLQSQFNNDEEQPIEDNCPVPDMTELKEEPAAYRGCRVPGRTFMSLQDNIATHPSVLKPRK